MSHSHVVPWSLLVDRQKRPTAVRVRRTAARQPCPDEKSDVGNRMSAIRLLVEYGHVWDLAVSTFRARRLDGEGGRRPGPYPVELARRCP